MAFGDALLDVKKRSYIKEREIGAFVEFAESIRLYIQGVSPVDMRVSWYTGFIDEFQSLVRTNESPFVDANFKSISHPSPVQLVEKALTEAVQNDIPSAWQKYSTAFYKLKLELTR
jgi:hypothetical protein